MKNKKPIFISGWILVLAMFGMAGNSAPSSASDDSGSWLDSSILASEPCYGEGSVGISSEFNDTTVDRPAVEDNQEDMDRFFKAKEFVFKRDWRAARTGFESYLKDFPAGRMRDEAHFWLAQSLNYLAQDETGREAILRLKKAALDEIQKLVDAHPGSLWRDDALAFRVEIAGELVLLGEESYQKYITEAVEAGNKSPRDLKLQALGALVNLDPATALPVIHRTLQTDGDAVVRDRCLTLLLLLPVADADKILEEVARSDRDDKVRSEAASLLEQVRQSRIPVKLRYFIYGSKLLDKSLYSKIPEGKVREFPLNRSSEGDAAAVLEKTRDVFGGKLSTPSSSANGQLPISPYFSRLSRIMNRAGDYQVWIKPSELKVTSEQITGKIEFRNLVTNEMFDQKFSVDRSADKLLAARNGDNLTLLMFQFAALDSAPVSAVTAREKAAKAADSRKEKGYGALKASSIITLHPGIQVRTERMSYDLHSFEKNLIGLDMAKAVLYPGRAPSPLEMARNVSVKVAGVPGTESISREPWVLIGDLFYFKDRETLLGYGAYLLNPKNELVAEGLIEVPAGDPAAFKVLSGRTFAKSPQIVTALDEERTRPIFSNLWSSHMGWEVSTASSSTNPANKIDFGLARADRHFGGRDWVLIGQIISLNKERKFIARQAALIASDGTIIHGAEIHVNVDDPTDHAVVVKQP